MPSIPRKTQRIFGSSLTPSGNVAQFGSLALDGPPGTFSNDPDVIQARTAFTNGLAAALVGNKSPALQDLNALFLLFTQQIAYILERGIPQWDTGTIYFTNDFCRVNGLLFVSQSDNNTGNDPVTDTNNWQPYLNKATGPTVAAAWAEFDGINTTGGNSVLHSSFNVDHIVKNADGSYTVVFANALPSAHYVMMGSCGSEDAEPYGAGDDGVVVGNIAGQGNAIRSATQCRIFTINPTNKALVASGDVSVIFFGR